MSWLAASFAVLGLALVAGFAWYERSHPSARVLALVATLAALAALGRIAFAPLPNVKPTTDIVLLAGYAVGGAPGFAVGAVAALASNVFFGQGPWTPWQMCAWGGVGIGGALLARVAGRELGRVALAAACGLAGAAYGAVMNVHLWVIYSGDHALAKLGSFFATSFAFDLAHVVGNVLFCLAFGPALVRALTRFRRRFDVTWRPAPALAAGLLAAVCLGAAATPPGAGAAVPAPAVAYLERAQNADGGFGPAPGRASTDLHTGWAALGLAAAGRNPADVRRGGRSVLAYVQAHARGITRSDDIGELTRSILVLASAGASTRASGRDLVAALLARRRRDGSFAGRVNTTAFAAMALRAAGRSTRDPVVRAAGRWIAGQANPDGGYNFAGRGGGSGIDDSGAAIQGLVAAGRAGTPTVRRAASFLVRRQGADGGFPLQPGGPSNAQSTAWAVQGLLAGGRDPAGMRRGGRNPLAYLESLVTAGGAVRYSRTSAQTPAWVTAQALTALARRPFPLSPVPRSTPPRRVRRAATPAPRAPATSRRAARAKQRSAAPPPTVALVPADLPARARSAGFLAAVFVDSFS
ncbi:MAG TPA: prenyltransferase/squalene oxidase repeat-containing protein [Solirubrobacteraceae bacterium]|nr:prenyltransferase/squalene oxidase repeat-containing protein [Solirubrobacteraceae bacterium]